MGRLPLDVISVVSEHWWCQEAPRLELLRRRKLRWHMPSLLLLPSVLSLCQSLLPPLLGTMAKMRTMRCVHAVQ